MSNANYNARNYPTSQATVSGEVQVRETNWGDKALLDFTLPNGEKVTVWDSLDQNDESVLLNLAAGQIVQLYQNDNGNWKLDKKSLAKKTTKRALAAVPNDSVKPVTPAVTTYNINNEDNPIRKQARLLRDCVDAVLIEFHGIALTDEVIQKYATSLFISITKN